MRIEKVVAPADKNADPASEDKKKTPSKPELVVPKKDKDDKKGKHGKVISISEHRKKDGT